MTDKINPQGNPKRWQLSQAGGFRMIKRILITTALCLFVTVFAQAVPADQGKIPGSWGAWTQIKKLSY